MRRLLLVLLVVVAVVAALQVAGVFDVVAAVRRVLGVAREGDDLRVEGSGGSGGQGGAQLQGVEGSKRPAVLPALPASEAKGTVAKGARIVGRVVLPGAVPQPVPGARLRLTRPHPITRYLRTPPAGRWDELEATSDAQGRFAFLDLRPARGYVVRAVVTGRPTTSSRRLDLGARTVVDLGDLVLLEAGAFAGRVVDGQQRPIPGARVAATWRVESILGMVLGDPELLPEIEAEALTDANGAFALEGLEPGPKTLVVSTQTHGAKVLGRPEAAAGQRVNLGDVELAGTGTLAGRVLWDDGSPVPGARVFSGEPVLDRPTLASVLTGADGAFRFERLEGHKATLGVFVPGIPIRPTDEIPMGKEDVVLTLPRAGALVGRVVRAADGQPVTRFGVLLVPKGDEDFMERAVRTLVDKAVGPLGFEAKDGAFRIPFQASGKYQLVVSADGFPAQTSPIVEVTAGGTADAGTIALREGHALSGTVRSRLGTPLEGARLFLLTGDNELDLWSWEVRNLLFEDGRAPDGVSDGEGRFEVDHQTPETYSLLVDHAHAAPSMTRGIDLRSGPRTDVEIVLDPAGAVLVRVLDAQGRPAPDVSVMLIRADGSEWGNTTGEDGQVRVNSVLAGPCLVRAVTVVDHSALFAAAYHRDAAARAQAYEALRREGGEHVVRAGEATDVVLRLPRRTEVTLRVRPWDPDLGDLRFATLWHKASNFRRHVPTDESGVFRVPLEPGAYEVTVRPDAGWEEARTFQVVVPDAPSHQVELESR